MYNVVLTIYMYKPSILMIYKPSILMMYKPSILMMYKPSILMVYKPSILIAKYTHLTKKAIKPEVGALLTADLNQHVGHLALGIQEGEELCAPRAPSVQ